MPSNCTKKNHIMDLKTSHYQTWLQFCGIQIQKTTSHHEKDIASDPSLSLLQNHKFDITTINWLPDNTPIQIHLQPFQKALFSLLNNPLIAKDENFSFPHASNPLTPDRFPEISKTPCLTMSPQLPGGIDTHERATT